ncbi:unnamed protein product [Didymodactylos carnosus]|uniref:Uncharacterized protein n=1 Tax=Didymodactylos carnosus TaxID=1234261 RepID=A0A815NY60_9BILA|nr:unnamed protein product [Didymodactylos carnosus]CAF1441038.1 unnamed protein product [Didymodactylos carnosus]CAF3693349.1 unnamed protein product [Didymodactylos carnosus]CAF4317169.1 unnamed protein product [Didymodactylos carnosus]
MNCIQQIDCAGTIEEQTSEGTYVLDLTTMINPGDRELTKMFADVGLAGEESNVEGDESNLTEATDDER